MPTYGLTGVQADRRVARRTGVAVLVVALVAVVGWTLVPEESDSGVVTGGPTIAVTLLTDHVGAGVSEGTPVHRAGVQIGQVTSVDWLADHRRLHLTLQSAGADGLTDGLSIDFVPANMFGITAVNLTPGQGGTELREASSIDLSGAHHGRVHDATVSTMLGSLGTLTRDVLTPDLADLVATVAQNARGFSPLLAAVVQTLETVAQTQTMPYSPILKGLGDAAGGLSSTLQGGLVLLNAVYTQPFLRNPDDRADFDATVSMLGNDLIPSVAHLLESLKPDYYDLAQLPVPLLNAAATAVGPSTDRDLSELLRRLDSSFADSPAGPILRLAVTIDASTDENRGPR